MAELTQAQKDRKKKAAKKIVSKLSMLIVCLASIRSEIETAISEHSEGRYCGDLQRANSDMAEVIAEAQATRKEIIAELHAIGALPYIR